MHRTRMFFSFMLEIFEMDFHFFVYQSHNVLIWLNVELKMYYFMFFTICSLFPDFLK